MPSVRDRIMDSLYSEDILDGFRPDDTAEVQGWNGDHPSLSRLASSGATPIIVDVGVWKGQSTINMALALKSRGLDGCIIAVDTFLGSPEHWDSRLFGRTHGLPDLYRTFLSNVFSADVSQYIVPLPQTSVTAAAILRSKNILADVVHIDAAHEYEEVIRDAQEYYSILSPGGFLIGDDYDESWPGVVRAAAEFSAETGRALSIEPPKWILRK